jgi:phosphoribosyl 1,2-cyclic phosphodiesterase
MSLFIASLNSGSNGNCYYVGNEREAVLVDAGISCRETEKRMKRLGLSMEKVKAIFISHEHTDHISGLSVISKKYRLPVFISSTTLRFSRLSLDAGLVQGVRPYVPIDVGEIRVTAFPKHHDASEPHSFIVEGSGVTVGVLTDIGSTCDHVVTNFSKCDAAFLEANYDEEMLRHGRYPFHLKQRITGGKGHLSNRQALQLFLDHKPDHMSHLILAHLSKENNCPELVKKLFDAHAASTHVCVASRYAETPVFHVQRNSNVPAGARKEALRVNTYQASLF